MITGHEQIHPTTDSNYINNSDVSPTVGVWGGLTLKQHMVVEFTKALIINSDISKIGRLGTKHWEASVGDAISISNEVIKQLNNEDNS